MTPEKHKEANELLERIKHLDERCEKFAKMMQNQCGNSLSISYNGSRVDLDMKHIDRKILTAALRLIYDECRLALSETKQAYNNL